MYCITIIADGPLSYEIDSILKPKSVFEVTQKIVQKQNFQGTFKIRTIDEHLLQRCQKEAS